MRIVIDVVDVMEIIHLIEGKGITLEPINLNGPGGGNPCIALQGPDEVIREFYDTHYSQGEPIETYVRREK